MRELLFRFSFSADFIIGSFFSNVSSSGMGSFDFFLKTNKSNNEQKNNLGNIMKLVILLVINFQYRGAAINYLILLRMKLLVMNKKIS